MLTDPPAARPKVRIVIVDDHPMVRDGLCARLTAVPHFEVVGEAGNGADAMVLAERLSPDLMLVDIGMINMNGISLTEALATQHPTVRVLILSMYDNPEYIAGAVRAGARGYVLKDATSREIIAAIDAVAAGGNYYCESAARTLADPPFKDLLTDREREVLVLLAHGHSNKSVAAKLGIKVRTVEQHRANVLRKLGIKSAVGLAKYALEHGYTQRSES